MRFIIDAQLPPALARMLAARVHEAEHVADLGLVAAPDDWMWRYAIAQHAVLVTKDEDFSNLALAGDPAPVVIWVRTGNTSRRALIEWFEPLLDQLAAMIASGERLIELR